MGFLDEEPTFTVGEFIHSWVPGMHWFDPSVENVGYTTAKLGMLVAPLAMKAAWIYQFGGLTAETVALHGGRWQAAGYLATQDSIGMFRVFQKGQRAYTAASIAVRVLPVLAVGYGIVSGIGYVYRARGHHLSDVTLEPGQFQPIYKGPTYTSDKIRPG